MKRPLALVGLSMLFVLTVISYFNEKITEIFYICAGLSAVYSAIIIFGKFKHKLYLMLVPFAVLFSCLAYNTAFANYNKVVSRFDNTLVRVEALAESTEIGTNSEYTYTLKAKYINDEKHSYKINLYSFTDMELRPGDEIIFDTELYSISSGSYMADKIYFSAYEYTDILIKKIESPNFYYKLQRLNSLFSNSLRDNLSFDSYAIAKALVFGDKCDISSEIKADFRNSGVSHILVVSGLHMSIIAGAFILFFKRLFKKRYLYISFSIAVILMFTVMTGLHRSVVRSAVMVITMLLAQAFGREGDSLNSLGLSAVIIFLFNPFAAFDLGVQLSFSAVLGIVLFMKRFNAFLLSKLPPKISEFESMKTISAMVSLSIIAFLSVLPISLINFGQISNYTVIANFIISPVAEIAIILSLICAALLSVPYISFIAYFPTFILECVLTVLRVFAGFFADLPGAVSIISTEKAFVLAMVPVFAALIFGIKFKKPQRYIAAAVSCVMLFSAVSVNYFYQKDRMEIKVYNAGGIFATFNYENCNIVLCCNGSAKYSNFCIDKIRSNGNTVNVMYISSYLFMSQLLADSIINSFNVENAVLLNGDTPEIISDALEENSVNVFQSEAAVFEISDNISIQIIGSGYNKAIIVDTVKDDFLIIPYKCDYDALKIDKNRKFTAVISADATDYNTDNEIIILADDEYSLAYEYKNKVEDGT